MTKMVSPDRSTTCGPGKDSLTTGEMSCGPLWLEDCAMALYAFDVDDTLEAARGVR